MTVFVCKKEDITNSYFGTPFASTPNDVSFVQGTRVLSGNAACLDELGVLLDYSYADIPVYEKGCSLNIKDTVFLVDVVGTVTAYGVDETLTYTIDTQKEFAPLVLETPEHYYAFLQTVNSIGDVISFSFDWYVIEKAPGPQINEILLTTKSQEIYDLISVYYGVQVQGDCYIFEENGHPVEKSQYTYYAFADYDSALSFALRVEKESATRETNGQFSYQNANNPLVLLNEYELYQQMYAKAKENVKKRYFSNANALSMRIFTPCDASGNVRTYDDGITETVAYCLEKIQPIAS